MGKWNYHITLLIGLGVWTTSLYALPDPLYQRCLNALRIVWEGSPVKATVTHPISIVETVPSILIRDTDDRYVALPAFNKVNGRTLPLLFSHQYDAEEPNQFGAKGLVYKALNGEWKVMMWSTGQGVTGNNLHHRDALATVLEYEASIIEQMAIEKDSINSLKLALALKEKADRIRNLRQHDSVADNLLTRFHGFQMRALKNPVTGGLKFENIDMDSSLASALASRKVEIDGGDLTQAMQAIQDSILPEFYPPVYSISHGTKMNIKNRDQLTIPRGSHVLSVPYGTQ